MKRLEISTRLKSLLSKSAGQDIDTDKIAVYEAIVLNTRPISQKGTIFDGAKASRSTLKGMVDYVASGETVPMLTMHNKSQLPVGTLFHAEMYVNDDDEAEVRGWFYLDLSQEDMLAKLDQGIINEVSVGVLGEKLLCSECGFDYLSAEATFDNLYYKECNEGHVLGEEGCHIRIIGLESWSETSLVNRGAANKPKIVGKSESRLQQDTIERLAASGIPEGLVVLNTSAPSSTIEKPKSKETDMDMEKLLNQVSELSASAEGAKKDLELSHKANELLKADLAKKDEEIAALTEKSTVSDAEISSLKASREFFIDAIGKSEIALAKDKSEFDEDVSMETLVAKLKSLQSDLTAALPVGGQSLEAGANDPDASKSPRDFSAFKRNN